MKYIFRPLLAIAIFCVPSTIVLTQSACLATQAEQAQTLQMIGVAAKTTVELAAQAYLEKRITEAQWQKVAAFYDTRFQPSFRIALAAVSADHNRLAPDTLIQLSVELSNILTTPENASNSIR